MKRTVILGAGASKSYDKSKTGVRMPVAIDFFETFRKLDISKNPWVLIEILLPTSLKEIKRIFLNF